MQYLDKAGLNSTAAVVLVNLAKHAVVTQQSGLNK
jgi:hypothetical protein